MQLNRDQAILKHMIRYCDEISQTVDTFGNSKDTFASNFIYQNAVALCVLQVGELIDIDILWDTVQYDIPSLKKYCLQYI